MLKILWEDHIPQPVLGGKDVWVGQMETLLPTVVLECIQSWMLLKAKALKANIIFKHVAVAVVYG